MMSENEGITSRRKKLLYLGLFLFQIMVVFWPLLAIDLIEQKRTNMGFDAMSLIQTLLIVILIVTNTLFIREFIKKKWVLFLVIASFIISTILGTIARAVPSIANNFELSNALSCTGMFLVLINLILTFYVAVIDIFRIKHDAIYSLVGAANIFLLIGSIFSFLIGVLGCLLPGLVVPVDQAMVIDIRANEYAFYTLASIDLPYNDVNPFIRKVLVLESIFAHLFVVIIIGRLLSK